MSAEIPQSSHEQVADGTYQFFDTLLGENEGMRLNNLWSKKPFVNIGRERICGETGGSCVDIQIQDGDLIGVFRKEQIHAHITTNNCARDVWHLQIVDDLPKVILESVNCDGSLVQEIVKIVNALLEDPETTRYSY